ncbi:MAG: hypothetical protein KY464_11760 [Gemmatimonadetes bacterium]|nr:hypothetical protein [Gemmatimonadota bacterium]
MIANYERDIRHFARGFRAYIRQQLEGQLPAGRAGEEVRHALPDGTTVVLVRRYEPSAVTMRGWRRQPMAHVMVVQTPVTLQGGLLITAEVYATQALGTGPGCTLRGILGEADLDLGGESVVLRWLHGEADVHVGRDSILYGRASAEGVLRLEAGCRFERIQAGRIEFGRAAPPQALAQPTPTSELDNVDYEMLTADCWMVRDDCGVSPATRITPSLVVHGELTLGAGSHALQSLKGRQDVQLERGCRVDGSLVSGQSIRVGEECRIAGPMIAERDVHIAAGTVVGSPLQPTTISAENVTVGAGAVVFGAIWTRGVGRVT